MFPGQTNFALKRNGEGSVRVITVGRLRCGNGNGIERVPQIMVRRIPDQQSGKSQNPHLVLWDFCRGETPHKYATAKMVNLVLGLAVGTKKFRKTSGW
jgi:hypothetical protein